MHDTTDWATKILLMSRFFDTDAQLGRFLGVSEGTIGLWRRATACPTAAAQRLIRVMEQMEMYAPEIHAALVREARNTSKPV